MVSTRIKSGLHTYIASPRLNLDQRSTHVEGSDASAIDYLNADGNESRWCSDGLCRIVLCGAPVVVDSDE